MKNAVLATSPSYVNDKNLLVNMGVPPSVPAIQTIFEHEDGFKGRLLRAFYHPQPASWIVAYELGAGDTSPGPDSRWLSATDELKQSYLSALKTLAEAFPANDNGKSSASIETQRLYKEASAAAKQGGLDKITTDQLLRLREFGQKATAHAQERGDDNGTSAYKKLAEACHAIIKERHIGN